MNKIPSVFLRNPENMHEMTRELNPLCQWVIDGEGTPTRKYDGTCMMLDADGKWWARREVKKDKVPPAGWVPVQVDDITGKKMGWEPTSPQGYGHPLMDALGISEIASKLASNNTLGSWDDILRSASKAMTPGTYELCGPKINGNPEHYPGHQLVSHEEAEVLTWWIDGLGNTKFDSERAYDQIKHMVQYLSDEFTWEGLVWHHPDGRMAKMKARDYRVEGEYPSHDA